MLLDGEQRPLSAPTIWQELLPSIFPVLTTTNVPRPNLSKIPWVRTTSLFFPHKIVIPIIFPKSVTLHFPVSSASFLSTHIDSEILKWIPVDLIFQHMGQIGIIGKPYSHSLYPDHL